MRLKSAIFAFLMFCAGFSFAQGNWGGGVDDQTLHFGFTFQYVSSEFKIQKADNWSQFGFTDTENPSSPIEQIKSISAVSTPGFGLGFVSNLYLTPHLDLRFTPTLVFADRVIDYQFDSPPGTVGNTYEQDAVKSPEGYTRRSVFSTMTEFPLSIKLKSDRKNNFRAYLIGGIKYAKDIASKKKTADADKDYFYKNLKNNKGILSYEAGLGFDIYFEFFKLSPEIKLSNSFKSVLSRDNEPYSQSLDKLFLRNFIFSLYFE